MKRSISSIPQLYRNVRRWTDIVSILSKYGLADWLSRFNIDFLKDRFRNADGEVLSRLSQEARIRLALTELGPTFIKFGQLLSTRPDLIGSELADELSNLQSNTPADPFDEVKETIETEQGKGIQEIFQTFQETPIASASIGQVHRATLHESVSDLGDVQSWIERLMKGEGLMELGGRDEIDEYFGDELNGSRTGEGSHPNDSSSNGHSSSSASSPTSKESKADQTSLRDVVVKVRHSRIERVVETDLDILAGLAQLAERLDDFRNYQPTSIVNEMARTMRRELDFERELRNLMQFQVMFQNDKTIQIPRPIPELCSSRMITMQRMNGTKLRDVSENPPEDVDLVEVAKRGANLYLKMIFHHGFYHADPHPGNIMVMNDGSIGLLDFGMVGRISEQLREDIEAMLVAIVNRDVPMLTTLIKRIGSCPIDLDESALSNDVADFVGQYSTQVLAQFDMSGALNDFVNVVRRYNITLPSEAAMLIKTLVTLEGTGRLLNPNFSLMEIMKPFQRMLVLKRMSPARQMRKMRRFYMEVEQLAESLPNRVSNILEQIQSGSFDVHLVHRRLGPSVNRLVVGLMTSALFLGSALMLSYKVPPLMFPGGGPGRGFEDVSMLGLTGAIVSIMMGLRLLWSIRKSGNLDQPE